jgi:hypothetical protein
MVTFLCSSKIHVPERHLEMAGQQQTRLRYIDEFLRLSSAPMMLEV